ncbi:MAG: glycosyltransferase family 4 protein [Nanoarchaeota archaeon]|nr:glycosyltransferase family 4 protein [Nanoarchaeota archaeon]
MGDNKDLKILYVGHDSLNTGAGVSTYIKNLMFYFKNSEAVTFRNKYCASIGQREFNLNAFNKFNEVIYFQITKIRKLISKIKNSDLIHDNPVAFYNFVFILLCKIFNKQVVSTFHSNVDFKGASIKKKFEILRYILLINLHMFLTNKLILVTNSQKESLLKYILFKKLFRNKSEVIYNFIDSSGILKNRKPIKSLNIIIVGRLDGYKGFGDVLKLINILKNTSIKFHIFGEGILSDKIPKYRNVKYYGQVDNKELQRYYNLSNVLLFPSYSETFGLVILEAWSKGLTVVASDLPVIREYFKEERNGYFFNPGDIIKMKNILIYLKNNMGQIEKIGKNNLQDVKNFTDKKQIPKYKAIYGSLLKNE